MPQKSKSEPRRPRGNDEGRVLTRAVIHAAQRLEVSQNALAAIIGVSEPTVSRMRRGSFALERDKGKSFELAALFVRLASSLDAAVHGDQVAAREWLKKENVALRGRPLDLIQSIGGLVDAVHYLVACSELP